MSETPRREITVKRHNIEFLWGWFDALRRRDTESMAAALDRDIVWQGARPGLVCHGPEEVIEAFLAGYDANHEVDSLELVGGDEHIVLGVRAPELAIDGVDTDGEIYNVFTIEAGKITRIEDHLEREAAFGAAGITARQPTPRGSAIESHDTRVRRAEIADADAVGQLLHDFNGEFDEPTPGPRALAGRVRQLLAGGDTIVLLGGAGPDGLAVLRFREAIWTQALECYLAELYVVAGRRGHGLGRALMETAMDVARGRGATYIDLGTSEDDVAARALYESLGFSNREGRPDGPVNYYYEREL
jgi:ribosomal protein S18 acetylase RimI-like enzyme